MALNSQIRRIYQASDGTYGSPRVPRQLKAEGHCCNEKTVAKLMRQWDLAASNRRRFRIQTTNPDHIYPVAANLLEQCFTAEQPDEVRSSGTVACEPCEQTEALAYVIGIRFPRHCHLRQVHLSCARQFLAVGSVGR